MILLYNNNNITTTTTNKTSPPPCRCLGRCSYGPRQSSNAMLSPFSFFFPPLPTAVPFPLCLTPLRAGRGRGGAKKGGEGSEWRVCRGWVGLPCVGFCRFTTFSVSGRCEAPLLLCFGRQDKTGCRPDVSGWASKAGVGERVLSGRAIGSCPPGCRCLTFLSAVVPLLCLGARPLPTLPPTGPAVCQCRTYRRRLARPRLTSPPLLLPFFAHPVCGAQPPDFQSRLLPWRGSWLARIGRIVRNLIFFSFCGE